MESVCRHGRRWEPTLLITSATLLPKFHVRVQRNGHHGGHALRGRLMGDEVSNVALVTKTLVHNASSIVERPGDFSLATFLDFSALCEAVVILDRMQAIQSSDVLPRYRLSIALQENGHLEEFRPQVSREDLQLLIRRLPDEFVRFTQPTLGSGNSDLRPPEATDNAGALVGVNYGMNIDSILAQLEQVVSYPSLRKGPGYARERIFRSNGYLLIAAAHGLDYFPDFDRAPFVAGFLDKVYRSLPLKLYKRVAEALHQPVDKDTIISEWARQVDVPIPPVTALVLDRARNLDELPDRLLEVRGEFGHFRRHFRKFKADLQGADTLKERRKLRERYQRLLAEASGPDHHVLSATQVLNFAEKAVKAAAAPNLPTSYSAGLLSQPVEWLRNWWLRRPLAVLFRLDSKLPRLSEYRGLIAKHWGVGIQDSFIEQYTAHAARLRQLMSADQQKSA